jgi:hypothetical protein
MFISRKLYEIILKKRNECFSRGILPDYLSLSRQPMSDYQICRENCGKFFHDHRAFAGATGSHVSDKNDVFDEFNDFWQVIRKSLVV